MLTVAALLATSSATLARAEETGGLADVAYVLPPGDEPSALAAAPEGAPRADAPDPQVYRLSTFGRQARSIPFRLAVVAVAVTAFHASRKYTGFHFKDEGFFGRDTANLGVDKLHHSFDVMVFSDFLTAGIDDGTHPPGSAITGALLGMGFGVYSELFDGFSREGFSYEDSLFDLAGAAFSALRNSVPGLKDKLDYRMEYVPSRSIRGSRFLTDFAGQKYLFALKLSGFERMERSPLRFVELHAGYYARGFTAEDKARGDPLRRRLFVGVGVNLAELIFPHPRSHAARIAESLLHYYQPPYTSVNTSGH